MLKLASSRPRARPRLGLDFDLMEIAAIVKTFRDRRDCEFASILPWDQPSNASSSEFHLYSSPQPKVDLAEFFFAQSHMLNLGSTSMLAPTLGSSVSPRSRPRSRLNIEFICLEHDPPRVSPWARPTCLIVALGFSIWHFGLLLLDMWPVGPMVTRRSYSWPYSQFLLKFLRTNRSVLYQILLLVIIITCFYLLRLLQVFFRYSFLVVMDKKWHHTRKIQWKKPCGE